MKRIIFLLVSFSWLLGAQQGKQPIYFSAHVVGSVEQTKECPISFKIPFNNLVFVKEGDEYSSGLKVNYEIWKGEELYKRFTTSKSVTAQSYDETSSEDLFLEGLNILNLEDGSYSITPTVSLYNTKDEYLLDEYKISLEVNDSSLFKNPFLVYSETKKCFENAAKQLVNFGNVIPFDQRKYDMIIPVVDEEVEQIKIVIEQYDQEVLSKKLKKHLMKEFEIDECDGTLFFAIQNNDSKTKTFLLTNINKDLQEGPVTITVFANEKELFCADYVVAWLSKPKTLYDIEVAAELFAKITEDNNILDVFDDSEENYYKNFFNFWKNYDRDDSTVFNEVMNEFYMRADEANERFGTANNVLGIKTDRGRVFVKYGEPDKINREYTNSDRIIEQWVYEKLDKEFYFEDTKGLGNYQLID